MSKSSYNSKLYWGDESLFNEYDISHSTSLQNLMATTDLIKLFSHLSYDICMFHVVIHVRRNSASTAWAVYEELDQLQKGSISILFVCFDPLINHSLDTKRNKTRERIQITNTLHHFPSQSWKNHFFLTLFICFLIFQWDKSIPYVIYDWVPEVFTWLKGYSFV